MSELEVLVPMKPLSSAKSRLSSAVPDTRRQAVALCMLSRVLEAVVESCGKGTCQVVGGDELIRSVAEEAGCRWLPEPGHDLNSSLWAAMHASFEAGARAVLFLPADLPQAAPSDVATVVAASQGLSRPVGMPAKRDGGTNALLLPAAVAFPPQLGILSYALHVAAVRARDGVLIETDAPGLAFDVDTPEDLAWAVEHVEGFDAKLDWWTRWLGEHERHPSAQAGTSARGGDHG